VVFAACRTRSFCELARARLMQDLPTRRQLACENGGRRGCAAQGTSTKEALLRIVLEQSSSRNEAEQSAYLQSLPRSGYQSLEALQKHCLCCLRQSSGLGHLKEEACRGAVNE
jgi:hypothetical protein